MSFVEDDSIKKPEKHLFIRFSCTQGGNRTHTLERTGF